MQNEVGYTVTVFQKIGTPLFSFYNFSKCWPILVKVISLCSLGIFPTRYNIFTYWSFEYYLQTRIRSVERGICPIPAACTVLFYCPDVKT